MGFQFSKRAQEYQERLTAFMDRHVYPNESLFWEQLEAADDRWESLPLVEELKAKAKAGAVQEKGVLGILLGASLGESLGESLGNLLGNL